MSSALRELFETIARDLRAASASGMFPPLVEPPHDDDHHRESTIAPPARRRPDHAAKSTDPIAHPDTPFGMPVVGRVSSAFGMRFHPIRKERRMHWGEDIAAPEGTTVVATAAGVVRHAGPLGTYGNLVEIDHENGYVSRYGHLSAIAVTRGEHVERGTVIGAVGHTGAATGPHLHFEILEHGRFQNPALYLARTDGSRVLDR